MLRLTAASIALSSANNSSVRRLITRSIRSLRRRSLSRRTSSRITAKSQFHFVEQFYDASEPLVALNREMQRLAFEGGMIGVEECDHWARLSEMTPSELEDGSLASRLVWSWRRQFAALVKCHPAARCCLRFDTVQDSGAFISGGPNVTHEKASPSADPTTTVVKITGSAKDRQLFRKVLSTVECLSDLLKGPTPTADLIAIRDRPPTRLTEQVKAEVRLTG
jgi:hypothetical protein